jgi:hypothetical protein
VDSNIEEEPWTCKPNPLAQKEGGKEGEKEKGGLMQRWRSLL